MKNKLIGLRDVLYSEALACAEKAKAQELNTDKLCLNEKAIAYMECAGMITELIINNCD